MFYLKNIQNALPLKGGALLKVGWEPQGTCGALGEVAERLNAAVLKTAGGAEPLVGSNPTLSVDNQEVKPKIVCSDSASFASGRKRIV